MNRLRRLQVEAKRGTEHHAMGRWIRVGLQDRACQSTCAKCGAWLQVIPNPYPNEIEIGGNAWSVECTK